MSDDPVAVQHWRDHINFIAKGLIIMILSSGSHWTKQGSSLGFLFYRSLGASIPLVPALLARALAQHGAEVTSGCLQTTEASHCSQ